jgi:carboxymethylproline synthase
LVLESAIKSELQIANDNEDIDAIIVTGGSGRSFSAGGDFNEVKNLSTEEDINEWIDRVIDLYASVLKVRKPTIAAIDGYAIGMGFQFAMMFDWRVMSKSAEFCMPELKHGIGCSVGATILDSVIDWNSMKEIVFSCDFIGHEEALRYRLVNQVSEKQKLIDQAILMAKKLANYPQIAFENTKKTINKSLLEKLYFTAEESKKVHRAAFAARSAQSHFKKILGKKY